MFKQECTSNNNVLKYGKIKMAKLCGTAKNLLTHH